MRIRQRITLGFLSVVVIFLLFAGYLFTVWQGINADMIQLDQAFEETSTHTISELESTLHMVLSLETFRRGLHEYALGHDDAEAEVAQSITDFDHYYGELRAILVNENSTGRAADRLAAGVDFFTNADKIATLDEIEASHEQIQLYVPTYIELVKRGDLTTALALKEQEIEREVKPISARLLAFEQAIEAHTTELARDFDAVLHGVQGRLRNTQAVTVMVLSLGIMAAFVIGYYTSEAISEPIERLAEAAGAVEAGNYELNSLANVSSRADELGQFARTFEEMARQVAAHEQKLQAQVSALQIEIDRSKSTEQVAEITETDFFKDLQTKARAIRANKDVQE